MINKKLLTLGLGLAMTLMSSTAVMAYGFVQTDAGVKYDWGNGTNCVNNWVHLKNHWYYFGNDGLMRTGWIQRDDTWYFATSDGKLQAETVKINGNVYQFDKQSCKLKTGYQEFNGRTYRFTENGVAGEQPYVMEEWNSDGTVRRAVTN